MDNDHPSLEDPIDPQPAGHLEEKRAERTKGRGLGFTLSAVFVSDELPDIEVDVPATSETRPIEP